MLRRVVESLAQAARECECVVVAGDTKALGRGNCDGIYLSTTGLDQVRAGDHGAAMLLARQAFGLRGSLSSDAAGVLPEVQALMTVPGLRFMRDPTRGVLATVAHEIVRATGFAVKLSEVRIPGG